MTSSIHGPACGCSAGDLADNCKDRIDPFSPGVEFPEGVEIQEQSDPVTTHSLLGGNGYGKVLPFNRRERRAQMSQARKTRLHK